VPRQSAVSWFLAFCVLILCCGVLEADVIYTNFAAGDAYSAGNGLIVTNDKLAGASIAMPFTPAANYDLTGIDFVATDLIPDDSADLTIGIYGDNGGQPGGPALESFTVDTPGQFGNLVPVLTVTSAMQPLLEANTVYWVAMDSPTGNLLVWNQNTTLAAGFSVTDGSGNWSASSQAQGVVEIDGTLVSNSFSLETQALAGTIPEPETWWLMAAGLAALFVENRRRNRLLHIGESISCGPCGAGLWPALMSATGCYSTLRQARASPTRNNDPVTNVVIGVRTSISRANSSAARNESATRTLPLPATPANTCGFSARGWSGAVRITSAASGNNVFVTSSTALSRIAPKMIRTGRKPVVLASSAKNSRI
jgi:hypothetical protein